MTGRPRSGAVRAMRLRINDATGETDFGGRGVLVAQSESMAPPAPEHASNRPSWPRVTNPNGRAQTPSLRTRGPTGTTGPIYRVMAAPPSTAPAFVAAPPSTRPPRRVVDRSLPFRGGHFL